MKRHSTDQIDFDSGGPLTDKWVVKDPPKKPSATPKIHTVDTSYVKFEELNELGRFSFNSYNKDVEVIDAKVVCVENHYCLAIVKYAQTAR